MKLITRLKIFFLKRRIERLETSMMIFEIPYDIAIGKLQQYETRLEQLKSEL